MGSSRMVAAVIIRILDGTNREIVVRRIGPKWVASSTTGNLHIGVGATAADAISDILEQRQ